jgi:hypothetical protein
MAAPDRWTYSDLAIARQDDELEVLDLFHATDGGEQAVARKRRDDAIRVGVRARAAAHEGAS